ncbi:hypothetical protein [Mycolicibacterium sphagni]|uniref:Trimeric autotransporter adhesin YadA-like head domain-containing protein n=1 Tax=Mycolicibacterium sphagni TaxID=1786 RepID=A0ABX2K9K6_9MYCO|nr:hypothetical protein [Mycolicibacterium sphagni]NTY62880.1 hypothetical protein [Mycolicibacterium sphagni]
MTSRVDAARRLGTGVLLTAVGAAIWTAASLGSAPAANATCASLFGIGNSASCTSNPTSIAIAIGTNAQAHADGLFGSAFAIGDTANARIAGGAMFNTAAAIGSAGSSYADGTLSTALALGTKSLSFAGTPSGIGDVAIVVGSVGGAEAYGNGNLALDVLSRGDARAQGTLDFALTAFGRNPSMYSNSSYAGGSLSSAINVFGEGNAVAASPIFAHPTANLAFSLGSSLTNVTAGPGPFAIAGAIGQHQANISKSGPGININGVVVVGGAAAVQPHENVIAAQHSSTPGDAAAAKSGRALHPAHVHRQTPR